MIDYSRSDVIEALEYLLSPVCTETQFDYCDEIRAAIAFLKEQEPRVMTRGEVIKLNDWIWVDYKDGFNGYEYKLDYDSDCDCVEWLDGATDGMEEYGKTWRCWTSRPSEQQMREAKWEDKDAE